MILIIVSSVSVIAITVLLWHTQRLGRRVSAEEQQQALLKKKVDLLQQSQYTARAGSWEWDVSNDTFDWSNEAYEMLGYEPGAFVMDRVFFLSSVHPDDRDRVEQALGQILEKRELVTFDHRFFTRTGEALWLEHRAEVFHDDRNGPRYVAGVCQEITERKVAELELLEKQRTLQLILDNAPIGIWLQDRAGRLLFVNRAYCDAVGISEEQFLAVDHYAKLYPDEFAQSCIASDDEALAESGPHHSYEKMLFVDGEVHDLEVIKIRLTDSRGVVNGLIGLSMDVTARKQAEENLKHLALHDGLTGLPNRNYFVEQLQKAFSLSRRREEYGALLFFDCDHFKVINDSLGHQVGDAVLQEMGRRLTSNIRQEDVAARLGGDEFVVMAVNLGKDVKIAAELTQSIAEKLKAELSMPYSYEGQLHHLTPSIGVSLFPHEGQTADDVLKHADTAMYRAKDAGRDTIRFFALSMQLEMEQRLRTQAELRRALSNDELELHYQPQINAVSGVTGVEALIRWNHPERGMVFPGDFIEIAEQSTLIVPIGEWVLRRGLEQLQEWRQEGLELDTMAINLSPKQFHQEGFVDYVKGVLQQTGVSGERLELELTENILLDQTAETVSHIEALKEVGIRFSIDDFGTGYSSMAYLKKLPLDRLKIDRSFVNDVTTDINDAHIVKTIIGMSHNLGLELIAEGVETAEQKAFLLENSCDNFQGYFFSRPIPASSVIDFCCSYRPDNDALTS